MKDDDLTYGARSGIQKAVRRGDLDLARTCFEVLWSDKQQRNWLKWRLPILVAEEAWFFSGELGKFLAGEPSEEEEWRRFIYRLVLVLKNKDASALHTISQLDLEVEQEDELSDQIHWELAQMRSAAKAAGDDPPSIIRDLYAQLDERYKFSNYEKAGLEVLIKRSFQGGMLGDKWFLLAAIILTASRHFKVEKVAKAEAYGIKRWSKRIGKRKPRSINLPWWVFDMHTGVGKIALKTFMKRKAKEFHITTPEDLAHIWFLLSSGMVPDDLMRHCALSAQEVSCLQSAWWVLNISMVLDRLDSSRLTYAKCVKMWPKVERELNGIVTWLLERRES